MPRFQPGIDIAFRPQPAVWAHGKVPRGIHQLTRVAGSRPGVKGRLGDPRQFFNLGGAQQDRMTRVGGRCGSMMASDHFGVLSADMLMWVRQPAGESYSCLLNEREVVHSYPIESADKPIEATIWITLHKQFMVAAGGYTMTDGYICSVASGRGRDSGSAAPGAQV